jgi:hypothetical protein
MLFGWLFCSTVAAELSFHGVLCLQLAAAAATLVSYFFMLK